MTHEVVVRRPGAALGTVLLALAGVLCSCGDAAPQPQVVPGGQCPSADAASAGVAIDWVSFVVLDGVQYFLTSQAVEVADVAEEVGRVKCRIAGTVTDPSFDPRDGDAAYLPPGTALHVVRGQPLRGAVAVEQDGSWRLYTAEQGTSP